MWRLPVDQVDEKKVYIWSRSLVVMWELRWPRRLSRETGLSEDRRLESLLENKAAMSESSWAASITVAGDDLIDWDLLIFLTSFQKLWDLELARALANFFLLVKLDWRFSLLTSYLYLRFEASFIWCKIPAEGEPASSQTLCQKLALDFRDLAASVHPGIAELLELTSGRNWMWC